MTRYLKNNATENHGGPGLGGRCLGQARPPGPENYPELGSRERQSSEQPKAKCHPETMKTGLPG
ncbi:Hypothetical predicted protein, partial [Marmota monax]